MEAVENQRERSWNLAELWVIGAFSKRGASFWWTRALTCILRLQFCVHATALVQRRDQMDPGVPAPPSAGFELHESDHVSGSKQIKAGRILVPEDF